METASERAIAFLRRASFARDSLLEASSFAGALIVGALTSLALACAVRMDTPRGGESINNGDAGDH